MKKGVLILGIVFSIMLITIGSVSAVPCGDPGSAHIFTKDTPGQGTFVVPDDVSAIKIQLSGGGGGGGGGGGAGISDIGGGGGGGGGGEYYQDNIAVNNGNRYHFYIGMGGLPGSGGPKKKKGNDGNDGESSWIYGPNILTGERTVRGGTGGKGGGGGKGTGASSYGYGGYKGVLYSAGESGHDGEDDPECGSGGDGGESKITLLGESGSGGSPPSNCDSSHKEGDSGTSGSIGGGGGGGAGGKGNGGHKHIGGSGGKGGDGAIYITYQCDLPEPCTCNPVMDYCAPGINGIACGGCYYDKDVSGLVDYTCDLKDDDCDGNFDEDFAPYSTQVGVGECKNEITYQCIDGATVASGTIGQPEPETCDGLDNDCDGYVDEETNFCNKGGYCNGQQGCIYPEAYWAYDKNGNNKINSKLDLTIGTSYYLVLTNPPSIAQGKEWKFEIYEKDLANADDKIKIDTNALTGELNNNKDKAIAKWTITQEDVNNAGETLDGSPFKFYFNAKIGDAIIIQGPEGGSNGGNSFVVGRVILAGKQVSQGPGGGETTIPPEYSYSSGNLELEKGQQGCFDNDNDGFNDADCGGSDCNDQDENINPDASEICDGVDNNCNSDVDESCLDCSQYTFCSDYGSDLCSSDPCAIASDSVENDNSGADCINNICECSYDTTTSKCDSSYSIMGDLGFSIGSCHTTEDTSDTCEDDNLLTYQWEANWVWSQENEDYKTANGDYYDPESKASECVGGEQTISCPSQVKMPLTNWFGNIASIIFITLGYLFFTRKRKLKNESR